MTKLTNRYNSSSDANMRLGGTVVRYKTEPVYIHGHVDGGSCNMRATYLEGFNRRTEKHFIVDANDPELDISSPPIGYVNTSINDAVHVARHPYRRQKQGLDVGRLSIHSPGMSDSFIHISDEFNGLAKTIKNIFPTFEEGLALVQTTKTSCAVSRHLALVPTGDSSILMLYHLVYPVGFYTKSDKTGFIFPKYYNPRLHKTLEPYMEVVTNVTKEKVVGDVDI